MSLAELETLVARNPPLAALATAICMTVVILALLFREQAAKAFKLAAGVVWRVSVIPLGLAVPAVGWWQIQTLGDATGWWTADPMPPSVSFENFCLWTFAGLATYMAIGRGVRAAGDAVRAAWKDAQPDSAPPDRRDPSPSGGGGAMSPNSVYFRALEARLRTVEVKVAANTKSLNTRSRNASKVKQRLDELEAKMNFLKGDAPNDGEEV